ncbi:hypothetical protein JHK87_035073 [Glycine soja]|nr:hypothetical protein JHK87_035073 [Glycine soja]
MHSATHAKAERLLGTHSHIHNLGLDSSLEPHAVSNDMVGEIAISPTPLIWASNLTVTSQQMGANVTVNCVHPGIVRTRLTREREGLLTDLVFFLASKLLKTIPQAAATTCYVATHPRLFNVSDKYFADCNEISTSKLGSNSTEAASFPVLVIAGARGSLVSLESCQAMASKLLNYVNSEESAFVWTCVSDSNGFPQVVADGHSFNC